MDHESADSFNDGFVQTMYESYLADPSSVSSEWQTIFADRGLTPPPATGNGTNGTPAVNPATVAAVAPPSVPATPPAAPPKAAPPATPAQSSEVDPKQLLRGPAAGLVKNMNESLTVPTATTFRTIAVATLDTQRRLLNAALKDQGKKLSFTHLVAWALIKAWREFPVMGHAFQVIDNKPHRLAHPHVNFGLAVDVAKPDGSRGLMVPCVHEADTLTAVEFFDRYDGLVQKSREGKLGLEDMIGTTMTLTNPGGLGTEASVPRLMAGQGTIIATGAIGYPAEYKAAEPLQLAQLGIGKVMTMTSTYDHRVIQGAESGSFLRTVDQLLQGDFGFYEEVRAAFGLAATPPAAAATPAATSAATVTPAPTATTPVVAVSEADAVPRAVESSMAIPVVSAAGADSSFETVDPAMVTTSTEQLASVAAAMALVKAHRTHGHLAARLDPLGSEPTGDPSLSPQTVGLSEEIMSTIPAAVLRIGVEGEMLADALPRLREKYCGTIAYEIEHLSDHEQRVWLRRMVESGEHRRSLNDDEKVSLLERLTQVEAFERFIRRAYLSHKQFSIEGLDMMVPMLDETIRIAARNGGREVLLGMAHRGRLNVLTHILNRPYDSVLREFEAEERLIAGTALPSGGTGDVKYHQGATSTVETEEGVVTVLLAPNPSHLEVVNPVVVGHARADQTAIHGADVRLDTDAAVPVLIHGDAAFTGQGVVTETLNMQSLEGYATGGTIHIIANNQLGFTTNPSQGRSTRYASDPAKGYDIPIIHVNADDPEACLAAIRLAMAYRARFKRDAVVDLIGYRRHGHNETDEPAYTQPRMYQVIKEKPRVRELFAERLSESQLVGPTAVSTMYDTTYAKIAKIHEDVLASDGREPTELAAPTGDLIERATAKEPDTALDEARVRELVKLMVRAPEDFTMHPKLARQFAKRAESPDKAFDFGAAEALAFGSLLEDGVGVRLTGQDVQRGTFSHRYAVLHDVNTGETYTPLQHLPEARASLEIYNSPLSEEACLGFEYGYGTASPDKLVVWEGQFGDFVNGAQVILDQFISSSQAKWGITSRLTLLLPHGYEGSGPEHSNGRVGRFLASAAEGNMRIANCTTSAQYFHLMRSQGLHEKQRPLIVMTPKGLLRAAHATSTLSAFTSGRFEWVLDDPAMTDAAARAAITRLVFCSGRVYYDIAGYADRPGTNTAVVRMELLYPFPKKQIMDLLANYPNVREVVWAQEEPQNHGPYNYMFQRLPQLLSGNVTWGYAGRYKRASTSEGYTSAHQVDQERIVREALGLEPLAT